MNPGVRLLLAALVVLLAGLALRASWADLRARLLAEQAGTAVLAGELNAAWTAVDSALAWQPANADLLRQASQVQGLLARFRRDPAAAERAVTLARRAAQLNALDARNPRALARALTPGARWPEALAAQRAALARDPHNRRDLRELGLLYEAAGRDSEAAAAFRAALAVRPDDQLTADLARVEGGQP